LPRNEVISSFTPEAQRPDIDGNPTLIRIYLELGIKSSRIAHAPSLKDVLPLRERNFYSVFLKRKHPMRGMFSKYVAVCCPAFSIFVYRTAVEIIARLSIRPSVDERSTDHVRIVSLHTLLQTRGVCN
jgi:hypothetical protein